jgi:putative ABC transport system permease protein
MGVLRFLLWFLPFEFRREYGADLLETAEDQWRETGSSLGRAGQLQFWFRQWFAAVRININLRCRRTIIGGADRQVSRREAEMYGVWKDVRHAARSLAARPGFTLVAVLTLGLGVGATAAMFSVVNSILFRALPYPSPENIVVMKQTGSEGSIKNGVSAANMRDVAATSRSLSHASIAEAHGLRLVEDGRAISLRAWLVSEGFFEAMGGRAHLGRTFLPEEFVQGREKVVVLSHRAWQTRFGGDPEIVGRELILDGALHTVVGVLPPEFKHPSDSEIWGPRPMQPGDHGQRGRALLEGIARLSPGTTVAEAQAEMDRIADGLAEAHPGANANMGLRVIPLRQYLFGDVESPLILLLGAVGLVLLIAAANVAGLQLARIAGRTREYALRGALGASSRRIVRLVAVENLLLAGAGGLWGIGLAYVCIELIRIFGPDHLPRIDELSMDAPVLAFALTAALGSAVITSLAPALRASTVDMHAALTEGSRGATRGTRATRLRDRLVVAEIALALMLTIGAGLLVRSLDRLLDRDLGFDPEGRLAVQVWAYDDNHISQLSFFERCVGEILAVPGVESVGLTTDLPLADDQSVLSRERMIPFTVDRRAAPLQGSEPVARLTAIDGAYAAAMGIPLVAGRHFSTQDHAEAPPVAMVNEAFVRRHLPDREPVGQRITLQWRGEVSREIVGVLADVRRQGFESEPQPEVYVPLSQEPSNGLTFVVKTARDPATLILPVQEAMWAVDASQAIWATRPMTHLLRGWLRHRRFNTTLLVAFAGLALSLAAIGVYALLSFSVEERVKELGIRRALGGQTQDILATVLRHGLALALAGAALGLMGSIAMTRLLRGMVFDIHPLDPLTFVALSVFVIGVAALAALVPARRATQVDPLTALRME